MTASKKVCHVVQFRILFLFPFLSLAIGTGRGDTPKGILLREGSGPRALLLIRGLKAGPSEGFDNRLRALGLHAHYWSEVRRLAPRKGSTAASGHSGSAPTTDPRPLLIRGSKAGPSEGFDSRLRALGLRAHYWSEVRRLAPRKGSIAASGHSGSAPTTDQGFEGWPPEGFDSRLRTRRARDDSGYVRYMTKAWATLPRYPRTFPRPAGAIL
jgi:hypothetical protein